MENRARMHLLLTGMAPTGSGNANRTFALTVSALYNRHRI